MRAIHDHQISAGQTRTREDCDLLCHLHQIGGDSAFFTSLHIRPPADDDAEHLLVHTVEWFEGSVEVEMVCEPAFGWL
jgi:hypothetical protein